MADSQRLLSDMNMNYMAYMKIKNIFLMQYSIVTSNCPD